MSGLTKCSLIFLGLFCFDLGFWANENEFARPLIYAIRGNQERSRIDHLRVFLDVLESHSPAKKDQLTEKEGR